MALSVVLGACGRGTTPPLALACDDLALDVPAGPPLGVILLHGVTWSDADTVRAVLTTSGDGAGEHPVALQYDSAGAAALVVPVHPNGTLDGGAVQVHVATAEISCAPLELTIAALPPAPGTQREVEANLRVILDTHVRLLGGTPEQLRAADPDTLAPPLLALALAQFLLDRSADDVAPRGEHAGLTDALLASGGFGAGIQQYAREATQALRGPHAQTAGGRQATGLIQLVSWQDPPVFRMPATGGCSYRLTAFAAPNAATLSCWMGLSALAAVSMQGKPAQIFAAFSAVLGIGGMTPVPGVQQAFAAAAVAALAYSLQMAAFADLLPSRFVPGSFEVDRLPDAFDEDDPGPGRWQRARIEAQSNGMNVAPAMVDIMLQLAEAGQEAELVKRAIGNAIAVTPGATQLVIPAQRFGPVDISEEEWTDAKILGEPVQHDLAAGRPFYRPRRVGTSQLRLSTKPGRFGMEYQEVEKTLTVRPILIVLTPSSASMRPGDVRSFDATVENALDKRLEWTIEPAAGHRLLLRGNPALGVDVVTSRAADDLPAVLTSRSLADRTHLLTAPERTGSATLLNTMLTLEPAMACVGAGDTLQFVVQIPDQRLAGTGGGVIFPRGPDQSGGADFRWSVSAGSVARDGTFRAPRNGGGTATITVVDRDDSALRGEVDLRYGDACDRAWTATVGGGPYAGRHQGSDARALVWGGKLVGVNLFPDEGASPALTIQFGATERQPFAFGSGTLSGPQGVALTFAPSGTLSDAVNAGTAVGYGSGTESQRDGRFPPPSQVEFSWLGDTAVVGTASGDFFRTTHPTEGHVGAYPESRATVRIEFRARVVRQ